MDITKYKEINSELTHEVQTLKIQLAQYKAEIIILHREFTDEHSRRVESEKKIENIVRNFTASMQHVLPNIKLMSNSVSDPNDKSKRNSRDIEALVNSFRRSSNLYKTDNRVRSVSPTGSSNSRAHRTCDDDDEAIVSEMEIEEDEEGSNDDNAEEENNNCEKSANDDEYASEDLTLNSLAVINEEKDDESEYESSSTVIEVSKDSVDSIESLIREDLFRRHSNDLQHVTKTRGKWRRDVQPIRYETQLPKIITTNSSTHATTDDAETINTDIDESILKSLNISDFDEAMSSTPQVNNLHPKVNIPDASAVIPIRGLLLSTTESCNSPSLSNTVYNLSGRPRRNCTPVNLAEPKLNQKLRNEKTQKSRSYKKK